MPQILSERKVVRLVLPDVANGVTKVQVLSGLTVKGQQATKLVFKNARWIATPDVLATLRFDRTSPVNIVTMSGNGNWDTTKISDGAGGTGDLEINVAGGGAGKGLTVDVAFDAVV